MLSLMSKAAIRSRQVGKSRWKTAWCLWMPFSLSSVAERGLVASVLCGTGERLVGGKADGRLGGGGGILVLGKEGEGGRGGEGDGGGDGDGDGDEEGDGDGDGGRDMTTEEKEDNVRNVGNMWLSLSIATLPSLIKKLV